MNGYSLLNLAVDLDDSGSLITVGAADARYVNVDGDAMTGPLAMGSNKVTGLANGTADTDAATFGQLEDEADYRTAADASLQAQISGATPVLIEERPVVQYHSNTLANSFVIPDEMNAFSIGPQITINPGQTVTLGENSYWNILGNVFEADELYNVTANNLKTSDGTTTVPVSSIVVDSDLTAYAPLASPALTGTPTAPTATAGTSTTQVATTAFVAALGALKANIASPTFTGTPAAPTAALSTNSTQLATTAFVRTGVTDASSAAAGTIGETLTVTGSSTISLTTATITNMASVTLTAGDWIVEGNVAHASTAGTTSVTAGFNTTTSAIDAVPNRLQLVAAYTGTNCMPVPSKRVNVAASTTIYLNMAVGFSSGTCTGQGYITARRIR